MPYARGYGLDLTEKEGKHNKEVWKSAFPEMELHMQPQPIPPDQLGPGESGDLYQSVTYTGRVRNKCYYCASLNAKFQGPAADGCKRAGWDLVTMDYTVVNFVHDEFIVELREDEWLTPRVRQIQRVMETRMREITPRVRISTEAAVMRKWSKAAEPVFDEDGNYVVWEPESEETK